MSTPMNAADYAAHAKAKRATAKTEIVTLKSGSVFELRRPNIQAWVMTGRVPQSLIEAGMKAWQHQGKVPSLSAAGQQQMVSDSAIFFVRLVQDCTVNPKLVEFPDPNQNEIGPDTMLDEDFFEIVSWAMNHQGVAGIDGLQSFREGRERGAAGDSVDSQELQPEAVESPAN